MKKKVIAGLLGLSMAVSLNSAAVLNVYAEGTTEAATEAASEAGSEAESEAGSEEATEAEAEGETEAASETESETGSEEAAEAASEAGSEEETEAAEEGAIYGDIDTNEIKPGDIAFLFVNDVHGAISNNNDYSGSDKSLGMAGLAAVKSDLESKAEQVVMIDLGDAIQGSVVTSESDGKDMMDLMADIGYDIRIPGNHEFDYGMEEFLDYAKNADSTFLSCNFIDLKTGEPVLEPYTVVPYEIDGKEFKVGYVGISTPETISKSTPAYFQDENENYIYGFSAETPEALYESVQKAIDGAEADGADIIVGLGHLGDTGVEDGWSSIDVIENTEGFDLFFDGHAHNEFTDELVDETGKSIAYVSTGTKLENIGYVLYNTEEEDGDVREVLIDQLTDDELNSDVYKTMKEKVDEIEKKYEYLFVKVGNTDNDLVIYNPEDPEERIVRTSETNMGDFLADAYRIQLDADVAFINGGSVRAGIAAGEIRYMDLISVMPWNSLVTKVEVTGQQLLDCLEMGAHLYPEECGGFIQVSGLTYTIDAAVPSSVNVNSDGEFVSVDGDYRVKDVKVGEEDLDPAKTYTLAINEYYSKNGGDGMTMFKGCNVLTPAEGEEDIVDHDVVIDYIATLDDTVGEAYAAPFGDGRITIINN